MPKIDAEPIRIGAASEWRVLHFDIIQQEECFVSNKLILLTATSALSLFSATSAQALTPNVYPAATLRGNGASSVANVLVQEMNCFGGTDSPLGINNNTIAPIPAHTYTPVKATAVTYNCATQSVQPNVTGLYVSTGSGGGRSNWKNFTDAATTTNPFEPGNVNPVGPDWGHIQFAFSDSPLTSTEATTDYNAGAFTHGTGAAIQIPLYVLPIAIGYSPVYGKRKTGTGVASLAFNVKFPHTDGTGGLRLSKATYCGIFNGTITNWNHPSLQADNGGQSLMSAQDDAARWASAGVKIRLVGRLDNSGTTNLFSRHMTAVCGGDFTAGGTDQLPAARKSTAVYDKVTGNLASGAEADGKFGAASGSDGLANAVDVVLADPTTVGSYTFNGRMGYVGADWVLPSTLSGSGLASADLQIGGSASVPATKSTKYAAATATNATAAFGKTILPPQSAANGKYSAGVTANGLRSDPLAWVLPANATTGLANPTAGYPIVGTTNMLLYTCYADPAVRNAVQGLVLFHLGKIATDSTGAKVPPKLVGDTAKDAAGLQLGILPRNGIAPLPASFITAIFETFLTKSTTAGSLNLWIQDKQPKKNADITAAISNPACTSGQGG